MVHLTAKNFQIETASLVQPVVVMFYADWCGKCAMMKPVVEGIEKKYGRKIKFCKVEIEESKALAADYGADTVPTFVLFKGGEVESIMAGVLGEEVLEERVKELL